MQTCGPMPLSIEVSGDLGIHEPSHIEGADALLERFYIGRVFVAAFVVELLICPGLPVNLHPDLSMGALAMNDDVANHQARHLLTVGIGGGIQAVCCRLRAYGKSSPRGPAHYGA